MGYAATTNVIYGVELSNNQAEEFINDLENILILHGATQLDMYDSDAVMEACQKFLSLDYFVLRGQGADSRVHDCEWHNQDDPLWHYVLGFNLGGHGYGCQDNLVAIIQAPVDKKLKQQWDHILKPILSLSGVVPARQMHTTEQIH